MEDHTIALLQECSQGCKMGIKSINQVSEYVSDQKLKRIMETYQGEHQRIEAEADKMLSMFGLSGKQPEMMVTAIL